MAQQDKIQYISDIRPVAGPAKPGLITNLAVYTIIFTFWVNKWDQQKLAL